MNKTEIMNKMSRGIHRVGFAFKKHSPEILVVGGVVGMVGTVVLASKATLKVNTIVEETKEQLEAIHEAAEKLEAGEEMMAEDGTEYTVEDVKKDTTIVYVQSGIKFAKLYGPAIALGALSITAILAGHNITRKRNVALAAAYTALDKGFKDYRGRVVERFGEELDKELRYNLKTKEVEKTITAEDGSEVVVKEKVKVAGSDIEGYSPYAKFFDESCRGFEKNAEFNMMFLRAKQTEAQKLLERKGRLFLNDVYAMLGIDLTEAGQVVGWIYDKNHPNGDNYIDFGLYNIHDEANRRFVNGIEPRILLDFNVDGYIADKL